MSGRPTPDEDLEERPRLVSTPKSFFVKERDTLYADWRIAWWREAFQNAVDAGAKRVDVEVGAAPRRGSFGRLAVGEPVTTLVFADDGCGMGREVLDEVYFSIGRSTKGAEEGGGAAIGGFGRARLLTCFAQARYAIHTRDRVVEGDGGEYRNMALPEAIAAHRRWLALASAAADAAAGTPDEDRARGDAARIAAELERLEGSPGDRPGCRIAVDLDVGDDWRAATPDVMRECLRRYLEQSDLPCAVTIDGTPWRPLGYEAKALRDLVATLAEGEVRDAWRVEGRATERGDGAWDVRFGRIASACGEECPSALRGEMVVRVSGAAMFTQGAGGTQAAVFVELDPAIARDVLNANRDGLKPAYKRALDELTALLSTDSQKALKADVTDAFVVLRGGLGAKRAGPRAPEVATTGARANGGPRDALATRVAEGSREVRFKEWEWSSFLADGHEGVGRDATLRFLREVAGAEGVAGTLLEGYRERGVAEGFLATLRSRGELAALVYASGPLLGFVVDALALRRHDEEVADALRDAERMADLNDVPMLRGEMAPPEGRFEVAEARERRARALAAVRRHDPREWDLPAGRGVGPSKVLAAWNVAVDACVAVLFECVPDAEPFRYGCGWTFAHPTWGYDSLRRGNGWRSVRAMARLERGAEERTIAFLLDPLDPAEGFRSRYVASDPDDQDALIALAAHEVAHAVVEGHDDAYAYLLTEMTVRLGTRRRRAVQRAMGEAGSRIEAARKGRAGDGRGR